MLQLAKITEALLPIAYCLAFGVYALAFFRRDEGFERYTRPALVTAIVIHSVLIFARTMFYGHCLVYSSFELMTMISYTVALTYLIVELTTGERGTGMFFIGLSLVLQTLSLMFSPAIEVGAANPALLTDVVGLHISTALIGYTAFAISAVYGGLYLMQYHEIRSNNFGTFYNRLPSLQLMERLSERAAVVGLVFLTIAIVIALVWLPDALPGFSYDDPKLFVTYGVWLVYSLAIAGRWVSRIEGRKRVILSLVGFAGAILSMTVINVFMSGFHRFG